MPTTQKPKKNYRYRGSVLLFDREIANPWTGSTRAVSEAQARNNLKCQVKRAYDLPLRSPIELPGRITCLE